MSDTARAAALMKDATWRLNHLYSIIDKEGVKRKFSLNDTQQRLHKSLWYKNIILKARQLGISSYVCFLFLDRCLFNSHTSAGIIAHTREDAEHLFKRVKFAYDDLPVEVRGLRPAILSSARELTFNNGSSIRVGTSMRSSTLQYLHISEFGKICAHFPDKAREIVTGSLNTVGSRQYVFIESTAEGKDGPFYEICKEAEKARAESRALTPLDWRFHFYPWHECADYAIKDKVSIPKGVEEYFDQLTGRGILLSAAQCAWYYKMLLVQRDDMKREYPSYPDEAFESAIDGSYYAKWLAEMRGEGRLGAEVRVPWEREARVSVAWDIGYGDATALTFFQVVGQEIHIIDYYENSGEGLPHYASYLQSKPYVYDRHYAPHDIESHAFSSGLSAKEVGASLGIAFITLPTLKLRIDDGIEAMRALFPRLWIDEKNCSRLVKCLENYRKEYDIDHKIYKSRPIHNWASHGADSARYMAIAVKMHIDGDKSGITDSEADKLYNKYNPIFDR